MNIFRKMGLFMLVVALLCGATYGGVILMIKIGEGYQKSLIEKPVVEIGPYVEAVEAGEEVKLDDPDIARAVCFFVIMRKHGSPIKSKLWEFEMDKCTKERLYDDK